MKASAKEHALLLNTCKVILPEYCMTGNTHKVEVCVVAKGVLVYVHTPMRCDTTRYLDIIALRFTVVFIRLQNLVHEKINRRLDLGKSGYHSF
jgi:hypothetical protein